MSAGAAHGDDGPDADAIAAWIVERYPDVAVASAGGGRFFSCDADKHWPNLARIVTTDDFDQASDLSRDGVFRLNIGVSRATFDKRLGPGALEAEHDYTALDRLLPHPLYGRQHWLSILNPSAATFETIVIPLLDEAHAIVAARYGQLQQRQAAPLEDAQA